MTGSWVETGSCKPIVIIRLIRRSVSLAPVRSSWWWHVIPNPDRPPLPHLAIEGAVLDGFGEVRRRQDRGQAPRQHVFPASGVPSGRQLWSV